MKKNASSKLFLLLLFKNFIKLIILDNKSNGAPMECEKTKRVLLHDITVRSSFSLTSIGALSKKIKNTI